MSDDQSPTGLPTPCRVIGGDQPCEHEWVKGNYQGCWLDKGHLVAHCLKCGALKYED